jgi:outer membrane protein assembly factor BamA
VTITGTGADPGLADTLRLQLLTKPGATLSNDLVREDLRRLWALGVLSDVQVDVRSGRTGAAVTFAVTPQPLIDRVYVADPSLFELRRFRWLAGTPYEPVRVARMAKAAQDTLVADGYLDAKVAVKRAIGDGIGLCVVADRGPHVTIDRLVFPGRSAVPYAELVKQLRGDKAGINRPGGIFDYGLADEDRDRMLGLYYELGRINTKIDVPRYERHGDHVTVEIPIRESPVFSLGAIRVSNVRGGRVSLGIASGDVLVRSRISKAIEKLHAAFGDDTNIYPDTKVDLEARRIDLDFHIEWSRPWHALRLLPSR